MVRFASIPTTLPMIKTKVIIYFNHEFLIENFTDEFLEKEKIFAFCFDTTCPSKISTMRDYNEVLLSFPKSNRVLSKAFYIGNYKKEDWLSIIDQYLKNFFPNGHEIVVIEKNFTKET